MGLTEAQSEVTGLIRSRTAFATIEDRIEAISDLGDNERAALWLYAWSCQGRSWQRRTSMQHLQWITSGLWRSHQPTS